MKNPLILCVDLDEWYHCRWATGSQQARWGSVQDYFRDYYHSNKPTGEIIKPTYRILKILRREKVKATFFILGEVAEWYPELVREIAKEGHEIACHGMHHQDITLLKRSEFSNDLRKNRKILENLSGNKILGFRAPNLVIAPWLSDVLLEQKFTYDSSVCSARSIAGKYHNQGKVSSNPYQISKKSLLRKGDAALFEIPIPSFPVLKIPGAVSIATRIFGLSWTFMTLQNALRTGAACYYFHPYEFNNPPKLSNISVYQRIFMRKMGKSFENNLIKILDNYHGRIISCQEYLLQNEFIKKGKVKDGQKILKK